MALVFVPGPLETVRASRIPLAIHLLVVAGFIGILLWPVYGLADLGNSLLFWPTLIIPVALTGGQAFLQWVYPRPVRWIRLTPDALVLPPLPFGQPRVFDPDQLGSLSPFSRWSPMYRLSRMEWGVFGWAPASPHAGDGSFVVTHQQMERIRDVLGIPASLRSLRPNPADRPLPSSSSSRKSG